MEKRNVCGICFRPLVPGYVSIVCFSKKEALTFWWRMPLCNHPPICEGSECSIWSFCLSALNPSFFYSCDKKEKRGLEQCCRHSLNLFLSKREFVLQCESQHLIFSSFLFSFFLILTLFPFRFRASADFLLPLLSLPVLPSILKAEMLSVNCFLN